MSQSPPQISSYSSSVQKILRRLQQTYGDEAICLAVQALKTFAQTQSAESTESPQSQALLSAAYTKCREQTGSEWIHQAMLYMAVRTIDPTFVYDPMYRTWPQFLRAQQTLFESQILHEQLHVCIVPSQNEKETQS